MTVADQHRWQLVPTPFCHFRGAMAFYDPELRTLFSGDLFASYFFNVHTPPAILNDAPELIQGSLERVREIDPRLIVPQHYDVLDGALHRRRFDRLLQRRRARKPGP